MIATTVRERASGAGLHKVIGKLFLDNEHSRRLAERHRFREAAFIVATGLSTGNGAYVLVVELLLDEHAG